MKQSEIKKLLPDVMQRSMQQDLQQNLIKDRSLMATMLGIMERLHAPTEELLQNLATVFEPRHCPESFLPMLCHWLNLGALFKPDKVGATPALWETRTLPTESGYMRELIASAVTLSKWRGTLYGLEQVLQTATGMNGYQIVEGGNPEVSESSVKPFHIWVGVPREAEKYIELIERIVVQEKPAHISAEIHLMADSIMSEKETSEKETSEKETSEQVDSE